MCKVTQHVHDCAENTVYFISALLICSASLMQKFRLSNIANYGCFKKQKSLVLPYFVLFFFFL